MSIKKKVNDILERLDEERGKAVLAFAKSLLEENQNNIKGDIGPIDPGRTPKWSERTTGREVSCLDFIKLHYGKIVSDKWEPLEGLELRHIGNYDLELYNTYIQRLRRKPEEDLNIPKEKYKTTGSAEDILA